jgi:hypothetical protein
LPQRAEVNDINKSNNKVSQDSQSPGRDLKPGPPKYQAAQLSTRKCEHYAYELGLKKIKLTWLIGS